MENKLTLSRVRWIWKLERSECDHDEVDAFIVCAMHQEDAREIAAKDCGDEGPEVWRAETKGATCRIVGRALAWQLEGVLLRSFNAV